MIEDFYDSTGVVSKVTNTQNALGGNSKSWSIRIAALACRISSANIREVDQDGKITMRKGVKLFCDATATNKAIADSDRIVVDSKTYEVTGSYNPGMQDHHLEIDLVLII